MEKKSIIPIIRTIIITLAILNLILLFGFQYEMPSAVKDKLSNRSGQNQDLYKNGDTDAQPDTSAALEIRLESDTLTYDGSAALDLLSGVTVVDKDENPVDLDIYSSIKSTEDSNTKIITYSVRDEEGREATAERTLALSNYNGPTLTIGQPYPEILDVELNHILETFHNDNLLKANDGYGKDITSAIQYSYKIADNKARNVDITFTITNHFDDKVSETITVPIGRTKPLIVLNKTSVTIKKGETLDPLSYVESATNEEGEDLVSLIQLDGDVNTAAAGTYTITYTLKDSDQEEADPVKVTVVVEE